MSIIGWTFLPTTVIVVYKFSPQGERHEVKAASVDFFCLSLTTKRRYGYERTDFCFKGNNLLQ